MIVSASSSEMGFRRSVKLRIPLRPVLISGLVFDNMILRDITSSE